VTLTEWGPLSNLAFATATVIYVLAFVAHTTEWARARSVPASAADQDERVLVGAGADGGSATVPEPAAGSGTEPPVEPGAHPERFDVFGRIGVSLTTLAFLIHLVGVVARGMAAERVPWGNMFEFNTTGALAIAGAYLVAVRLYRVRWTGLLLTGFVAGVLAVSMLLPALYVAPGPLVPALHSYWLVIHVAAAAVAGGAFAVGAAISVLYLIRSRADSKGRVAGVVAHMPGAAYLDRVAFRVHAFAFPIWTFGVLVAGPIWAEYAWGRYWGWDPKEVWALITWVVYAAYLHARATAGWQGRRAAYLALVAFATFLFNYVGINLFAGGLHSYAGL
jgi:cytochrome c-type biogenesis protein CcsB